MADLRELLGDAETERREYKTGIAPVVSIARTICAFLNGDGGTVFCGVADGGRVLGLDLDAEALHSLETELQSLVTPTALFTVAVDHDEDSDRDVVTIDAPPGKDKPYVVEGGVWLRRGAHTRAADADALRTMFAALPEERWERRWSREFRDADLDTRELHLMVDAARRNGKFEFEPKESPMEMLRRIGLARSEGITNGGDVLFAKNPAARHPQSRLQFLRYETDKLSDAYVDARWFEGPLGRVADDVFNALMSVNKVSARYSAQDPLRNARPDYDGFALREGLMNALAHRDYASFSGGVRISIFPSRIEIWNSGKFPEGVKASALLKPHHSVPVNPDIAHALYLRGFIEHIGRGTERIAAACARLGAPPPKWKEAADGITLSIFAAKSAAEAEKAFNERQRALLEATTEGAELTMAEYRQRFAGEVTERQARRDLSELIDLGFVRRLGAGKATVYRRL